MQPGFLPAEPVTIGRTRRQEPAEDTAASLLSRADTLLYTVKTTGRNRVCLDPIRPKQG